MFQPESARKEEKVKKTGGKVELHYGGFNGWIIFNDLDEEKWVSIAEWNNLYDPGIVKG